MARHASRRDPRAHWVLLGLSMLVLLAELSLNGYVTHVGSAGTGPRVAPGTGGRAPATATGGGPVLRVGADGAVSSRRMPAKTIALTFDDGPDPRWTPRILAVLHRYRVRGTFFEVGSRVNRYPQLSRQVLAGGNEIGSHTFTHAELATLPAWRQRVELDLTSNAIAAATGTTPILFRPPYSSEPSALTGSDVAALRRSGYLAVLADRDGADWRRPGAATIAANATPRHGAGAVVLLHDAGGDRSQTVAALELLIPRLLARGYRFTTVSEALGLPSLLQAGSGARARGNALRAAQWAGAVLARMMTWLMAVALCLAALRLVVQLWCARRHRRRTRRGPPPRYLGLVSVIVPAYNEAANIAATVRSLATSRYPAVEVIVVDDGSVDGTAEIVAGLGIPGVRVVRQANAGKPTALNTGISRARGEILVLVDGDTVFEPDAVARLIAPLADPAVGGVSGNAKVANRSGLLGRWQHLEYVMGFNLDRRMYDVARCMPTVPGAIGAFRREAVYAVDGVSSATLAEDTDFTMAVVRAGWRVVYSPAAIAWTEAPSTLRQLWRQRYRWSYGTMQAMWKHRRALVQRGAAGRLGRRGLTYLTLFQVLLPLAAPAVDVYAVYGMVFLPPVQTAAMWAGLTLAQALTAAYALRLDGERLGPLWSLPLQQLVYRQMMYLVVIQSAATALLGSRLRWHRMARTGAATALAARVSGRA